MADVDVYLNQQLAGRLARSQLRHVFSYGLEAKEALCLSMPLRTESYPYDKSLHPVFQMNLPEGYLRLAIERATAKHFGSDDLTLLTLLGNHQIGRLRYALADNNLPTDNSATPALSEILSSDDAQLFTQLLARYALSSGVAGVQPKVLMDIADKETGLPSFDKSSLPLKKYIVKSWGPEFPELACNEFLCLSLARNAGLNTQRFYLSDNGKLLVCERFDVDTDGTPLGFEDLCVLQGKKPQEKYDASLESCTVSLLNTVSPEYQQQTAYDFFKLTLLNVQIRNGDAHLKNIGILYKNLLNYREGEYPNSQRTMAPVYDIVSTTPYIPKDSMALTLTGSKRWPKWKVLENFGKRHCNLSNKTIEQAVADIEAACTRTQPLLEKLIAEHPGFDIIGEHIHQHLIRKITE
jgi:serine/threonine-protein kinase HipA